MRNSRPLNELIYKKRSVLRIVFDHKVIEITRNLTNPDLTNKIISNEKC
jgi:hypothetical protein